MISFLKYFFPINKYTIIRLIIMIIGFLLIPILIGFPIIIIGVMIFSFGLIKYFYNIFCIIKKI